MKVPDVPFVTHALSRFCSSVSLLFLTISLQGASLQLSISPNPTNLIGLQWTDLGSNYSYIVQSRPNVSAGAWLNHPPTYLQSGRTNSWTPSIPPPFATQFYRISGSNAPAAGRGKLRSSTLTHTYTTFEIAFIFAQAGVQLTPTYAVKLYKVLYETVDPFDNTTTASGALLVPVNPGKAIPLLSYQHGTIVPTNDAPTRDSQGEVNIGVAFATSGYASAVPDYLGLGDSPGYHPFLHARSEATAVVDMLRASKAVCASNSIALNTQLFLCGYSEGGYVTMAAHRQIEARHASEFTVTACAPMAGPYDLSGVTTDDGLSGRLPPNPYYFAYILAAYQGIYHLADSWSDLLDSPYDVTIPPLMNGSHTDSEINAAMPADPAAAWRPDYLKAFRADPNHPLRLILRENDVYAWAPKAPMRLYHCDGDQDVVYANSQVAYDQLLARGASVQLINPSPGADHSGCFFPSLLAAKNWFDTLKQ